MVAVKINAFGGMIPATDAKLLPDQAADLAQDCWLYDGKLAGLIEPALVRALSNPNDGKTYRIPISYADALHFDNATWMDFQSLDTDVIRSPVSSDSFGRYYWASPLDIPRVNSLANIQTNGSANAFALGVPAPTAAPTSLTVTGGTATNVSRAYALTYVTAFGEEGPPGPPIVQSGHPDGTWALAFAAPGATLIASNNLSKVRVYRTVTSTSGVATFFFVAELAVTSTSYSDTATDATVSANAQLESTTWTAPPTDLQGFISLPNGMIAGWRANEIWFCEPYRPHAWPAQYTISVEYPIVGLGVTNQTLVVMTEGYPMICSGLNPSSMALSTLASLEPCMSRGSILSTTEGVYYASPNGLILVANGVATNVTQQLILKDAWNSFTSISTLRAARLGSSYFAFGSARPGVYQTDTFQMGVVGDPLNPAALQNQDYTGSRNGILVEPSNQRVAFNTVTSDDPIVNVFNDAWSGEVCIIRNGNLYRLNLADTTGPRRPFLWRSKEFEATDRKNFGAMRIYFNVPPWAPTPSPVRDTDDVQTLQTDQYGLVRVYADGRLVMTRELRTSGELMKLPSGFKADFWQVEVEGHVQITNFQMATSDKELKKV